MLLAFFEAVLPLSGLTLVFAWASFGLIFLSLLLALKLRLPFLLRVEPLLS